MTNEVEFQIGDIVRVCGKLLKGEGMAKYGAQLYKLPDASKRRYVDSEARSIFRIDYELGKDIRPIGVCLGQSIIQTGWAHFNWDEPTDFQIDSTIKVLKVQPIVNNRFIKPIVCLPGQLEFLDRTTFLGGRSVYEVTDEN